MSVNSKMTAIADAIREKTGGADALTLDGMAAVIPEVFTAGEKAEAKKIAAKHLIQTVFGNGTDTLTFAVPFEPDTVTITTNNYRAVSAGQIMYYNVNLRSVSPYLGSMRALKSDESTTSFGTFNQSNISQVYSYADGMVSVMIPSAFGIVFRDDCELVVIAEKYETRTDGEIITDIITRLDNDEGGSCTFSQAVKDAAFTDDEWAALIATKPNWTFTLA